MGCLLCVLEVQQFAVWEKDAKDESGFIGWSYLDLFPRGMAHTQSCFSLPLIQCSTYRVEILACGRVGSPRWL